MRVLFSLIFPHMRNIDFHHFHTSPASCEKVRTCFIHRACQIFISDMLERRNVTNYLTTQIKFQTRLRGDCVNIEKLQLYNITESLTIWRWLLNVSIFFTHLHTHTHTHDRWNGYVINRWNVTMTTLLRYDTYKVCKLCFLHF